MKSRVQRPKSQLGFTLIELLVVVAIIAVLIAVLLPALARARAQAQATVCASRLKQLGAAFQMYTDDNAGILPPFCISNSLPQYASLPTWQTVIAPHLGVNSEGELGDYVHCPADPFTDATHWRYIYSYGGNTHLGVFGSVGDKCSIDKLPDPTDIFILTDINFHGGWHCINFWEIRDLWLDKRHHGGLNVLFCDGHVAWQEYSITNPQFGPIPPQYQ